MLLANEESLKSQMQQKPRRSGDDGPPETALFNVSENPSDTENDEGPEKGAHGNHGNGRPAK